MAMKETVRSMRIYFILVGVFGVWGGIGNVTAEGLGTVVKAIAAANLLVSAAILYCGIQLRPLLANKPDVVIGVLIGNLILIGVVAGLIVLAGGGGGALLYSAVGGAITLYLIVNVRRLSQSG